MKRIIRIITIGSHHQLKVLSFKIKQMRREQEARRIHQKNERITIKNGVEARNEKENSIRNVDEITARKVRPFHQIYRYRY